MALSPAWEARMVEIMFGVSPMILGEGGGVMAQDGKVTMTEVGKYPRFWPGELANVPAVVESTAFGRHVAAMRARARAAGLSESEVEKISTCPLVKLLVTQK